jgi:hypothetical protein
MRLKSLAIIAVLLAVAQAPAAKVAKAADLTGPTPRSAPLSTSSNAESPTPGTEDEGGRRDYLPQRIIVANPPATPVPWTLHEQITWAANLVLVLVAYAGILLAVSVLKKIERQTGYAETAAEAAAASAQAALLNAQAIIHAERPWILITVEPSRSKENSFTVMAANRGRAPAKIMESSEQIRIVINEKRLPVLPDYESEKPGAPLVPVILLPGESMALVPFGREDVRGLCDSEEQFKRIETWEEKIYLYGRVIYKDMIAPANEQAHETQWCCWYIHGRQSSGLVMAGPPEYNSHT